MPTGFGLQMMNAQEAQEYDAAARTHRLFIGKSAKDHPPAFCEPGWCSSASQIPIGPPPRSDARRWLGLNRAS